MTDRTGDFAFLAAARQPLVVGSLRRDILQWVVFGLLFVSIAVMAAAIWYWSSEIAQSRLVPIVFATFVSALLALVPALLCLVQNASRRRQHSKLANLATLPVAKTAFFTSAINAIDSIRLVVDRDYAFPIFLLSFMNFLGFMTLFFGFSDSDIFKIPIAILSGLKTVDAAYQSQTFIVIAMAFIGSYVYAIGRILDRINNNDLYPVSLYYYICRTITACAVAGVLRHTITLFSAVSDATVGSGISDGAQPLLILLGFAIGFAPDQFILVMTRRAFQAMKTWSTRADPGEEPPRPTSLPLLMIDDLTREKIDRLNELGIDSAQMLSKQNPFLLMPRLPFDLGLLVDWIAQAQLYVLVKETALAKLRATYVRDIFDLHIRLQSDDSRAAICQTMGIEEGVGKVLVAQLEKDAAFVRLRETRDALRPHLPAAT
jgi:hypothetical protein